MTLMPLTLVSGSSIDIRSDDAVDFDVTFQSGTVSIMAMGYGVTVDFDDETKVASIYWSKATGSAQGTWWWHAISPTGRSMFTRHSLGMLIGTYNDSFDFIDVPTTAASYVPTPLTEFFPYSGTLNNGTYFYQYTFTVPTSGNYSIVWAGGAYVPETTKQGVSFSLNWDVTATIAGQEFHSIDSYSGSVVMFPGISINDINIPSIHLNSGQHYVFSLAITLNITEQPNGYNASDTWMLVQGYFAEQGYLTITRL